MRKAKNNSYRLEESISAQSNLDQMLSADEIEKLRAEAWLEKQKLSSIFMQAPAAITMVNRDKMAFELVNDAFQKMVNRTAMDLIGKSVLQAFPDIPQKILEILKQVLETGQRFVANELPIDLDWDNNGSSTQRFLNFVFEPYRGLDGSVRGLCSFAFDVTEQVLARRKVQEAEERLNLALVSANVGFWNWDIPSNQVTLSDTLINQWGIEHRAAHYTLDECVNRIHEDDRDRVREELSKAISQERIYDVEYRVPLHQHHEIRWIHAKGRCYLNDLREPSRLTGITLDITDQKNANELLEVEKKKFEAIFVDSPAIMALLHGPDFIFEKVNPQFKAMAGGRDLIGKPFGVALPELIEQPIHEFMLEVYKTGKPHIGRDVGIRLKKAPDEIPGHFYFDFTCARVDDSKGNPYGIYVHCFDVTDKFLAKQRSEELAVNLQAAVHARDEFLSIASHELKTPITSLSLQLQMTKRQIDPRTNLAPTLEKLESIVESALKQTHRITELIEDLLDVSRIQAGKLLFHFQEVEIAHLIQEVIDRYGDQARSAHCALELMAPVRLKAHWDRSRIEQVIVNLISNAIKYAPGKPIHIEVRDLDGRALLIVRDQGPGIDDELQKRVFERFERASSARNISGLGLGLYIVKQIVEGHEGSIRIESRMGQGTAFIVELPLFPHQSAPARDPVGLSTWILPSAPGLTHLT